MTSSTPSRFLGVAEAIRLAIQHQAAGRLPEAEGICRHVLDIQPDNVDALHFLGLLSHQRGDSASAAKLIKQVIAIRPHFPEAYCNLGVIHEASGNFGEAIRHYQRAIELKHDYVEAHCNLGNALRRENRLAEAIDSYRRALTNNPAFALGHFNLGMALEQRGEKEEAARCYRQAIALNPGLAEAHCSLGNVLAASGNQGQAVSHYRHAIAIKPDLLEGHIGLGNALQSLRRHQEAVAAHECAVALKPDSAIAHNNLGLAWQSLGKPENAVDCFWRALQIDPNFAEAYGNLGGIYQSQGMLEEAVASQRRALVIKPEFAGAHSNLLYFLNYDPALSAAEIYAAHREWDQRHAAAFGNSSAPFANSQEANRRLKIGYVSPDFRMHAVAHFVAPFFERHDKSRFEVFCFYNHTQRDELTRRIKAAADHWHSTVGLSDEATAQLIREHRIDILVDLAGHTADNRLLVFARKPAPIQVTYLGYPGTTGLRAMDYRISDWYADPAGSEAYYSEKLLRLPHSLCCYQAPGDMPDIAPLPALENGYVTFGSLNNFNKIRPQCIEVWATLLRRLPGSRLLMLTVPEGKVRRRLMEQFSALGIGPERLELHGKLAFHAFHEMFRKVDIALDPFPLTGGTTTCETLWMGVPVVMLVGKRYISRVGYSFLNAVGRQDFAAETPEGYIEVALNLAGDLHRLAATHAGLRAEMAASPLTDAAGFARELEALYRQIWTEWCASAG